MGSIGVRPAQDRCALWFYVDMPLALPDINIRSNDIFFPPMDSTANSGAGYLTPIGKTIISRVLDLYPTRRVIVRPRYFNLELSREEYWGMMLPDVVTIIRDATNDPRAVVRPEPPNDRNVHQWHIPLLNELFGG